MSEPDFKDLCAFVRDHRRDDAVILVWISGKPRVATLRPLAVALHDAGFRVAVCYLASLEISPVDMELPPRLNTFSIERPQAFKRLKGTALFISSEEVTGNAPADALRFAIHHSLPDGQMGRDYLKLVARKPMEMAAADFYAINVVQPPKHWKPERYEPYLDRCFPAAMLRKRRDPFAIVPFGYPKLDALMAEDTSGITPDTITYAPTQSTLEFGSVRECGAEIIAMLLEEFPEHRIAFRPYPGPEIERIRAVYAPFLDHPRFRLDTSVTGQSLMRESLMVVTDRSSVAVSYGLGYARPVVFYSHAGLTGKRPGGFQRVGPFGLRVGTMRRLRDALHMAMDEAPAIAERTRATRAQFIYNPGRSAEYMAEIVPDILAGRIRPEWLAIRKQPYPGMTLRANLAQLEAIRNRRELKNRRKETLAFEPLEQAFRRTPLAIFRGKARGVLRKMRDLQRYLFHPSGR